MTDQEINIAIAEACGLPKHGWYCGTCRQEVHPTKVTFDERHDEQQGGCGQSLHADVPDYCHDLNAMWNAEEAMTTEQRIDYLCTLEAHHFKGDQNYETFWFQVHATACQRAEAFLRTIGKWKD